MTTPRIFKSSAQSSALPAPRSQLRARFLACFVALGFSALFAFAQTGDEFYRAAQLTGPGPHEFRTSRVRYELLLAAAAGGHADAEKELAAAWDNLLASLGRPLRMAAPGAAAGNPEPLEWDTAPAGIRAVWRDPAAARAASASAQDNPEAKTIADADQADRGRHARMRELINAGRLRTAMDFANAARVMQPGARFSGYQLAHELAVSSLLLGNRGPGRSLCAATYDRMLRSVGHDQRFGTQQDAEGALLPVDETGIADAQRKALGCPTLAFARNPRAAALDVIKELTGPQGSLLDQKHSVTVKLPAGWTLTDVQRGDDDQSTSVGFILPKPSEAKPRLEYRVYPEPVPVASAGPEAALREDARKKAAARKEQFPDYANRGYSFAYLKINGHPALSWTADYTDAGKKHSEYFVQMMGPRSVALFSMPGPAAEIFALRAAVDGMVETVRLP